MTPFHITDNGQISLCARETIGGNLIHTTYADRDLDTGDWCLDCLACYREFYQPKAVREARP